MIIVNFLIYSYKKSERKEICWSFSFYKINDWQLQTCRSFSFCENNIASQQFSRWKEICRLFSFCVVIVH